MPDLLTDPIARVSAFFAGRASRPALLARLAVGRPEPTDEAFRAALVAQLRDELRDDGSVGGAALPTYWRAHELLDLGHGSDQPGTAAVMRWVLATQGQPGGFADGCTEVRHRYRACEHYLLGFFAPAPPEQRLAPVTLPNGKVFRAEPAARFALSCLALRAALRAGHASRPGVEQHLIGLGRLHEGFADWGDYWAPDLAASALHALAASPRIELAARLAVTIGEQQDENGEWPGADFFHVLEAMATVPTPAARLALARAVPALRARQRSDGSFGPTAREERALIGLRVLINIG